MKMISRLCSAFTICAGMAAGQADAGQPNAVQAQADLSSLKLAMTSTGNPALDRRNQAWFAHQDARVYYDREGVAQGIEVRARPAIGQLTPQIRVRIPKDGPDPASAAPMAASGPPFAGQDINTPASLACIYGLTPRTPGCVPDTATRNPAGGSGAIAIIVCLHHPNIQANMDRFSAQFGLPGTQVEVTWDPRNPPDPDDGSTLWGLEANMDVQWAHAMAPGAKIVLVEMPQFIGSMAPYINLARQKVAENGGGAISMSFSGVSVSDEPYFRDRKKIIMFASAGDTPGFELPSGFPGVASIGGTTIHRDFLTHKFIWESVWRDTGGDTAIFVPWGRPAYQDPVKSVTGNHRGTPDFSLVADPVSGAWVYDGSWSISGGTSLGSPMAAGIVNAAQAPGHPDATTSLLRKAYARAATSAEPPFRDVLQGTCWSNWPRQWLKAGPGYDLCTGSGVPKGYTAFVP